MWLWVRRCVEVVRRRGGDSLSCVQSAPCRCVLFPFLKCQKVFIYLFFSFLVAGRKDKRVVLENAPIAFEKLGFVKILLPLWETSGSGFPLPLFTIIVLVVNL